MRIALIGCMVMNREISEMIAKSDHIVRPWWIRQGLHDTPVILNRTLQETIDAIEAENEKLDKPLRFDSIVMAYGLCSNGLLGLKSRTLPIVVPRCDDCISLFLGSPQRYQELFDAYPGTYWYNRGWMEQTLAPSLAANALRREAYVEEYGEENADYLMECMDHWIENYRSCIYISAPLGDREENLVYAKQAAQDFHWQFNQVEGSLDYFEALLNGPWDEERFLLCPAGHQIAADYTEKKMRGEPC